LRFMRQSTSRDSPCTTARHVDEAHATVGTVDAGNARVQEGLVVKEIEVAPGLIDRVVHRAVGLAALGTGKPATGLEVDLDIEPLFVDVELGVHHPSTAAPGLVTPSPQRGCLFQSAKNASRRRSTLMWCRSAVNLSSFLNLVRALLAGVPLGPRYWLHQPRCQAPSGGAKRDNAHGHG
jgi:hypothetical protein